MSDKPEKEQNVEVAHILLLNRIKYLEHVTRYQLKEIIEIKRDLKKQDE